MRASVALSGGFDYQAMGLSGGQNAILPDVAAAARAEKNRQVANGARKLIDSQAAARCSEREAPARPVAGHDSFDFTVMATTASGPTVTVERIPQTPTGLGVSTTPSALFTASAEKQRKVLITAHVPEFRKVAWNATLPFLGVTLRNERAIQEHSDFLGERYARNLARAVGTARQKDRR
ncbi:Tat pathway signal sequence domain protein [Streptomyces sp. ISL-1]|uniref:Tat pathway signal sequence domain protein n=1 Tax=Streptomyces sp. ISL-1 TaxID=2817657 RepID=UPI001BE87C08|nr:Tat pathway signal sequence domain protein [Streptomyces sp. ISL-1]MBT2390483.1 Tat pathway signal sequence domain protein [Streptomyces sp. ISL-1]